MIPTPKLSHLTSEDYNDVYEPAEDTFLLMDALEADIELIKKLRPSLCLEVGSGSGAVITFLANVLGNSALYLCTDVNMRAAFTSLKTGLANSVDVQPVLTDLVSCLESRLQEKVDILLFNPPYVVTPSDEVGGRGIEASWAGGTNGREVTDRLLPLIGKLLSRTGLFYLVIIKENIQDEIEEEMRRQGLHMAVVLSRRSGPEQLRVLRFSRASDPVPVH
ncbi:PREDICTED: hemK methyltransferase family member 2-like isoform X1 [Priapulus caudatus]|uniref:HemK methyltransferase family member 2-like isoform X1 n=1 Tax=Priapulus caudatus TaxID=37621 RepID=A0ABM1FAV0_PRICU|nr:PREDICTED: hemK methyltransferase family member 2-like isoform X1 [Priapulus caudatus]